LKKINKKILKNPLKDKKRQKYNKNNKNNKNKKKYHI
jgi:hypothetical protein